MAQYEFSTIFFKKPQHIWKTAPSPQHSIILASMPEGEIFNINQLCDVVFKNKDNSLLKTRRDVVFYLHDCVDQGYIAELFSEKVYKLLREYLK